jgi:hypothetical protein
MCTICAAQPRNTCFRGVVSYLCTLGFPSWIVSSVESKQYLRYSVLNCDDSQIDNICTLSANTKFICKSFKNRKKNKLLFIIHCVLCLYCNVMYVKKLLRIDVLKRLQILEILDDFHNGCLQHSTSSTSFCCVSLYMRHRFMWTAFYSQ